MKEEEEEEKRSERGETQFATVEACREFCVVHQKVFILYNTRIQQNPSSESFALNKSAQLQNLLFSSLSLSLSSSLFKPPFECLGIAPPFRNVYHFDPPSFLASPSCFLLRSSACIFFILQYNFTLPVLCSHSFQRFTCCHSTH